MKFGNKKMHRYALGVRSGLHAAGKFGAKASHIAGYAAPIALATGNLDNTLVRIPVNCNRGSMIFYRPSEVVHYIVERQNLHSLEFFIKDDDNQDLILDGHDFQIQIKIDVIYPPPLEDLEEGTIIHKLKSQEVEKKTEDNKDGLGVN